MEKEQLNVDDSIQVSPLLGIQDKDLNFQEIRVRKTIIMPSNFYEKLLDMENKFIYEKSLQTINELMELYKLGVEYYSGVSISKQTFFMNKIKVLFSNKKIFKMIQEKKNFDEAYLSTLESLTDEINPFNSSSPNFLKKEIEVESVIRLSRTSFRAIKLKNTKSKNSLQRISKLFKERKKCAGKSKHKMSRKTLMNNSSLKIKRKFNRIIQNKRSLINQKEFINSFNDKINNAIKIIDNDIDNQYFQFQNALKLKKLEALQMNNFSRFNTDFRQIKKHSIRKKLTINEQKFKPRMKNSFQNLIFPIITNSSKDLKKIKKGKKKIISINKVFDEYLGKFHQIYFKNEGKDMCDYSLVIINKTYIEKINTYYKYQEQIEELLYMFNDDPNSNYHKSIDLMINQLELERENIIIKLNTEMIKRISINNKKNEPFGREHCNQINEVSQELIKRLIDLLNNL